MKRDLALVSQATLYVSLEPCAHWGNTPPCAERILREGVKRVVVGCGDSFSEVAGRGIALLRSANVDVVMPVLEKECRWINRRFFTTVEQKRPYIVLKWAQTADGYLAGKEGAPTKISHPHTDRLVHRWRAEEAAILVGYRTALLDNPSLTTRLSPGPSPMRLVLDPHGELPATLRLFTDGGPTVVIGNRESSSESQVKYWQVKNGGEYLQTALQRLCAGRVQSILVEGGCRTLQRFIDSGYWDEMRVIEAQHSLGRGMAAPRCAGNLLSTESVATDTIRTYVNPHPQSL